MKKLIGILLINLLSSLDLSAQTAASSGTKFIFFPQERQSGEINYFTGLSMAQLPTKIVEDVFDQVPMIELKMSYGLPYNFTAKADLSTNVFTNLITLAPAYSFSFDKLSVSMGNEFHFWYGFFKNDGFNISVLGWGYSPFASIGYDFEDFLLSFKLESNFKAQNTYMKNLQYTKNSPKFVGFTFSLAVEQPLWGGHYFALGFRGYYTNFFYKSWLSFSTFEQYTFYPEFFAGFIF